MTALPLLPDAGSLARVREAVAANPGAPEVPLEPQAAPFPAGGRCPGCGTALCRWCARVHRLTRQHLKQDGTCPYGHREPVKED